MFVLHRHSIRAPVWGFAGVDCISEKPFPRGYGYLTHKGIAKCAEVGKFIERRAGPAQPVDLN